MAFLKIEISLDVADATYRAFASSNKLKEAQNLFGKIDTKYE